MLKVSGLYIYPIKSLPGIAVNEARVTEKGFEHDRRWMLVDGNNLFISQRDAPQMTQLRVTIENDGLHIKHKISGGSITIPIKSPPPGGGGQGVVTIWGDTCEAEYVSNEADEWFNRYAGH